VTIPCGRPFWKMSGSGNDFIFFDVRAEPPGDLEHSDVINRLCARATGIGADGVVFLQDDATEAFGIRYFNRDGSMAELCGNASLCSARLAVEIGLARPGGFRFKTDAGVISARFAGADPEIDLQEVRDLRAVANIVAGPGEMRIGCADTGVPHLVVHVEQLDHFGVEERGKQLRHDPSMPTGANVNFVAKGDDGRWRIRTYERGVERETLACGTGSVASAALLETWGLTGPTLELLTLSTKRLVVTLARRGGSILPSLRGEARIVFVGQLAET
jgi:diaminopimelate epimerase